VVTSVADRLPERLARLIYVDTAPLPDGVSQADFAADQRAANEQQVAAQGEGWQLPPPPWDDLEPEGVFAGLDAAARARLHRLSTNQPYGTATQPNRLTNPEARARLPKLAIWCSLPSAQARALADSGGPLFSELATPGWEFVDLPTGHWPMFSRPRELAEVIAR
jgi:pimeloyl-ACP methyl ester carboxylesterase